MPCTWTGYGASPPAAYKYRGEHRNWIGGRFFFRKRGTNQGGKILEKNRKQRRENRKQGGEFI
jgi:hypothetical protein